MSPEVISTDIASSGDIPEGRCESVIVVGAGLVGAVQALLFARAGIRVTLVEKNRLRDARSDVNNQSDAISSRTVALSYRSWQLLTGAGLWPSIDCCSIQSVHVTQQGKFGSVKLNARKLDVEALGFVLSNVEFEAYLHDLVTHEERIQVIESATVVSVENDQRSAHVTIENSGEHRKLSACLVVAADGTHSTVRELLGIEITHRDYEQCAVLANVRVSRSYSNTAFERFTPDGPLALLPLSDGGDAVNSRLYSLIYTAPSNRSSQLTELSDRDFLSMVQKKFGGRLGRFEEVGKRFVAELALTDSMQQVKGRFVLAGNAVRTLHPVAGQGMNLALRDVFELVSNVVESECIDTALVAFVKQRERDQWWVTKQTDLLARLFTEKRWPLRLPVALLTGSGFILLDVLEPFKKAFAKMNMGHSVPLPNGLHANGPHANTQRDATDSAAGYLRR